MDKRGYKLQEFVAHSANVNCLKIGKKTHRNFITGGDDEKVNLWSIGKPTATTSLSGHTSPIESVAFDKTEVLVAAGASSGVIKLWDLEETKVVRTLNGHRSYCTALEFHPFGEFFASGSMDTNLKIWDIRKKGCIHTYKGHKRAVSTIRFSPDGRWVVSGGLDNVVKIWDLTAGKLLHEFKFHEGHIRSMDFHPLEFLLATGSSDKTVKFWDLETFEIIGSTRPEATGVRSVTFHPDGRTLFCGLDSSLKVYSWEPVISHDSLDMGWSTLGDLCINDGKLLGCSYYQNSVAVWVADTTLIEPHGRTILAEEKTRVHPKFNLKQDLTERIGSPKRSTISSDDDTKDIKNIYVDSVTPVASRKSPTFMNLQAPKEIDNLTTRKQVPATKILEQANSNSEKEVINLQNQNIIDNLTTRKQVSADKAIDNSSTKIIMNDQDNTSVALKPSHRRRPSTTKLDIEQMSLTATVMNFQTRSLADNAAKDSSNEKATISASVTKEFQKASSPGDKLVDSNKELKSVKYVNGVAIVHGKTRSLVERFEKREKLYTDESQSQSQTPDQPTQTLTNTDTQRVKPSFDAVPCAIPESKTSQIAVKTPDLPSQKVTNTDTSSTRVKPSFQEVRCVTPESKTSQMPVKAPDLPNQRSTNTDTPSTRVKSSFQEVRCVTPESKTSQIPVKTPDQRLTNTDTPSTRVKPSFDAVPCAIPETKTSQMPVKTPDLPDQRLINTDTPYTRVKPSFQAVKTPDDVASEEPETVTLTIPDDTEVKPSQMVQKPEAINIPERRSETVPIEAKSSPMVQKPDSTPVSVVQRPRSAPSVLPEKGKGSPVQRSVNNSRRVIPERNRSSSMLVTRRSNASPRMMPERTKISPVVVGHRHDTPNRMTPERSKTSPVVVGPRHDTPNRMAPEKAKSSPFLDDGPQTTGRGLTSKKDDDVAEDLLLNHDLFVSSLRSRLTKLQVVRHFFVQKDMRGAINALRKLADHAVQADVVSILMEKMDSLTLDIFSELLPVLLDLLDSKTDRHINVSLELLVKLVAVFGPVVSSTISAPPTVGVDLHAEKRLECCNECHIQLQKINKCLPAIIRRGGLPARCGQELNIILEKL